VFVNHKKKRNKEKKKMGKHQIALQALHVIPSTDQGRASYSLGHRQLSKRLSDGLSTVGQHYTNLNNLSAFTKSS
jgi:hypothetical protein